jgi:hypothetical protein
VLFRTKKAPVADPAELLAELDDRPPQDHRALLALRHRAGMAMLDHPPEVPPRFPEPAFDQLPDGLPPEIRPQALSPEVVRAAFLRSGCLLVRGLIAPEDVERLLSAIDAAYAARANGGGAEYEPFETDPRFERIAFDRGVVSAEGWGGLWPADAPLAAGAMFEAFDRAGLLALA